MGSPFLCDSWFRRDVRSCPQLRETAIAVGVADFNRDGRPDLAVGTTSAGQAVRLTNRGLGALTLAGITTTGSYSQTNNCAARLASNKSSTITVKFTPSAPGDTERYLVHQGQCRGQPAEGDSDWSGYINSAIVEIDSYSWGPTVGGISGSFAILAPMKISVSASYISGIQTSCHGRVGGALNDGAAVGEQGHLVGLAPEFQDEIVVPDDAVRLEAAVHLDEVDGALALMDLHGIPAAQGDVRAAFAGEMNEVAFATSPAAGSRISG